jgi:ABC-2 type transport system permease protein
MAGLGAVLRLELRMLRRDPSWFSFALLPLAGMALFKPTFATVLAQQGMPRATGAEQVVPGMTITFAAFYFVPIGFCFYREYGWRTWDRLRSMPIRPAQLLAGKVLLLFGICFLQMLVVFAIGAIAFSLPVRAPILLIALSSVYAWSVVAVGLLIVSVSRGFVQFSTLAQLLSAAFAALGGALVPGRALPHLARVVSPATPPFWAMRGATSILLHDGGWAQIAFPLVVLVAFTAGCAALSAARFRVTETKEGWV